MSIVCVVEIWKGLFQKGCAALGRMRLRRLALIALLRGCGGQRSTLHPPATQHLSTRKGRNTPNTPAARHNTSTARRRLAAHGGVTAVVITVHNALASTIDCLEALVATATGIRVRIVLVLDNCDAPTTSSLTTWSRRRGRKEDLVLQTNHSSYSLAANEGLRAALHSDDVDAVGLLNSDTVPSSGWLHGLRRVLFAPPTDDDLADAFAAADVDEDERVTSTELANYRLHPGEDAAYALHMKKYDANQDGVLTWPEVCPEREGIVRGCDDRDWACAPRAVDDDVAGLLPQKLAAVGALSNAASYQTVPWPTPRNRRERRSVRGWNVVALPAGWTPETAARAARLGATGRRADAGLLNGFCMVLSRAALDSIGLLDEETYPGGYGEENDWAVRARRAGWGLAVVPGVHLFHAKTQSYTIERRQELKIIARENSRAKWSMGEVQLAERLLKRSPHLSLARHVAEMQYTGWRAKALAAAPAAALVLIEGGAQPPDWLQNAPRRNARLFVRSCVVGLVDVDTCADYLAAPVFDYVVSTGPRGATTAAALSRCHPNVVHVDGSTQRPAVLVAPRVPRVSSQAPRRGAAAAATAAAMDFPALYHRANP